MAIDNVAADVVPTRKEVRVQKNFAAAGVPVLLNGLCCLFAHQFYTNVSCTSHGKRTDSLSTSGRGTKASE
jgi:hypothetical protein